MGDPYFPLVYTDDPWVAHGSPMGLRRVYIGASWDCPLVTDGFPVGIYVTDPLVYSGGP